MNTVAIADPSVATSTESEPFWDLDDHQFSSTANLMVDQQMRLDDHIANREIEMANKTSSMEHQNINGDNKSQTDRTAPGTFEKTSFQQILAQYNLKHDLPPTIELAQAFLMTKNMKEAASRVNGMTAGGTTQFLRNELVGDQLRLQGAMTNVSHLLSNVGVSDMASNFLQEQRNLQRAQSTENKAIRELIEGKIVDGTEYIRIKESIAETKSRVKHILEETFTSDDDFQQCVKVQNSGSSDNGIGLSESLTQENSEKAEQDRIITEKRISNIIKCLRHDAKEYLGQRDGGLILEGNNVDNMSIHKIYSKLRKNKHYRRKREVKSLQKGSLVDTLQQQSEQLKRELTKLEQQIEGSNSKFKSKKDLIKVINQYEQVIGLDKRMCTDGFDKSIAEVDSQPLNEQSYKLQNSLFSFCGLDIREDYLLSHKPLRKDLLGNIKKVPLKSTLLQGYYEHGIDNPKKSQKNGIVEQVKKKNHELVKVIGLEPEKLFSKIDKYKVQVHKMPKFSNTFERAEPIMPSVGMTVAGQTICSNQGGQMTFARIDGRSVISLQFNPYFDVDNDQSKKKEYDNAMKEISDQRDKLKTVAKQSRDKLESANIKRAWLNIVKKDLPKAFKQFQKFKADQDNNNKKQSQNCLKEVRKKALKTQRLQKESSLRAKRLTKDMMTFWKKRDKEITDLKRRKEKVEKEMRRKLEEEKEAILQKKRLEFIMQQSEIYAHFMSKKLGLQDEVQKQKQNDIEDEQRDSFKRLDIDEKEARHKIASMINENRGRINEFDSDNVAVKRTNHPSHLENVKENELEIDKFDAPDESHSSIVNPPRCFLGHLKHYQLKGLRWLDNLYEQGINGILADEMGLGKTIQAIALLAHLYENKGVWGPFLIIVPCTVLANWQNELAKFCPSLKVLPFFGSPEERKKLGKFLDPKNLYNPNMRINILLTSYNLIVNTSKDQMKILRVKWHYMILDEAQAIKNNLSRRWKVLLQFNARNRLLLTGTPIQNSMAELWALLHFIMPRLFDSHEQFQEWFSKDIEQHSLTDQGEINKHQLRRLHLVLKPFMLRRLKDDIELEIGPKTEYTHTCIMTHRQKVLYQRIKNKISTKDLFKLVENKAKMENLMNLVMQFRKVCNHPELFERRFGRIPLNFKELQVGMQTNPLFQAVPELRTQMKNPISFELPKLVYDECFLISDNQTRLFKKIGQIDDSFSQIGIERHMQFFNIFNTKSLYEGSFSGTPSIYSPLSLLSKGNKWSFGELSWMYVADPLIKQIALMHYHHQKFHRKLYTNVLQDDQQHYSINRLRLPSKKYSKNDPVDLNIVDFNNRDQSVSMLYRENLIYDSKGKPHFLPPLITDDFNTFARYSRNLKSDLDIYVNACISDPIPLTCRSSTFNRMFTSFLSSPMHKKALIGHSFKPRQEISLGRVGRDRSSFLELDSVQSQKYGPPTGYHLIENGILGDAIKEKGSSILELPNYSRLVTDCAKMKFLDSLLAKLFAGNHRVLIFCQMTKMLDILEDFLCWRKYTYFRMDGSTNLQDRRFMVEEYQKNPTVFAFLLSTRAGGIGVNLTGADTVIFYDNDWNPTIDAQAQDRAHRIGQTKPVSVYRLITKGTVEEKIVKRAKQKQTVQTTVYGGNALKADVFRPKDVVDMLLDEEEENEMKERQQMFLRTKRVKKGKHTLNGPAPQTVLSTHGGDTEMIDTFKKKETPTKVIPNGETKVKPGRKAGVEKQASMKVAAPQNIFATFKTTHHAQSFSTMPDQQQDEEEEDEEEDEDYKAQQRLLELLEKPDDDDDEEGVAIEYNSGEEGDEVKNTGKINGKAKAQIVDEGDEDEDMMNDEY